MPGEPLTLTQPSTSYYKGNSAGLAMYFVCPPTDFLVAYSTGNLVNGQRLPGCPKLRYMDHIRRILNKCNISTVELEQLSTDRDTWKSACASGLETYNVAAVE